MTHDEPPGEGWQLWSWAVPLGSVWRQRYNAPETQLQMGATLELWRAEWGNETTFVTAKAMHPQMNVAGLYWRRA